MSAAGFEHEAGLTRRQFVQSAAAASFMMGVPAWARAAQPATQKPDDLAIAIIGPGSQGKYLMTHCLKIPGVRFVAVCDIWPYHREIARKLLKKYDQEVNTYEDYRELLAKEKQLDAVIVATPDWVHAEHTVACLKAGKHVYCEKEMSNSLTSAAEMVRAARETGKLLQIGHQRRSEPGYYHALKLIEKDKVLGQITHCNGQWNRAHLFELGYPKGRELDADTLKRYGYANMDEFRNWRWYRKFSGGPMADLGSHQIDVYNWFLGTPPKSVLASAGLNHYDDQPGRDWYDNIMTIYEYETARGKVRAFYQVLNTTSHGDFYETFLGTEGSLVVSEIPSKNLLFREKHAKRREWEDLADTIETMGRDAIELKIGETLTAEGEKDPEAQKLLEQSKKPGHLLHLENFFAAVRGQAELTCPAELAYEVCVSVLKANEAAENNCRIEFRPDEFKV